MNEELNQFGINIEDIKEDNNLFKNIQKAIAEMNKFTLVDRYEVILNDNLIECKEKYNNYRTILGCRISYENLDRNISFIVKPDEKPSYEQLEEENQQLKKQKTDVVEFIKSHNPSDIGICGNKKKYYYTLGEDSVDEILRMLGEIDE